MSNIKRQIKKRNGKPETTDCHYWRGNRNKMPEYKIQEMANTLFPVVINKILHEAEKGKD